MIARNAMNVGRGAFGPRVLRFLLLSLSLVLISPASARVSAAEAASDIPGTGFPLRGGASGSVGGEKYDDVYSITVPSGSVLVASLRGSVGAQLGLYLFDPFADSVLSDTPVATSAAPGGNQRISAVIKSGGTYYLNVNGRNTDRRYNYELAVQAILDSSPPVFGTLSVRSRVPSDAVCGSVSVSDPVSGVAAISMFEGATLPAEPVWIPYTGRGLYCTQVAAGDGPRQISVVAKNRLDLVSPIRRVSTTIDDTAPRLLTSTPSTGGSLLASDAPVTLRFSEPVQLSALPEPRVTIFDAGGREISGRLTKNLSQTVWTWVPSRALAIGSVVILDVGSVQDVAGNLVEPTDLIVLYRRSKISLGLAVRSRTASSVTALLTSPQKMIGARVYLQKLLGRAWVTVGEVEVTRTAQRIQLPADGASAVRVRWEGDERRAPANSPRINVAP
jgi:hypothetical protein